jgi:hypothetical protein
VVKRGVYALQLCSYEVQLLKMKKILSIFAALTAFLFLFSSCDKHEWKDTKKLFEKHGGSDSEH